MGPPNVLVPLLPILVVLMAGCSQPAADFLVLHIEGEVQELDPAPREGPEVVCDPPATDTRIASSYIVVPVDAWASARSMQVLVWTRVGIPGDDCPTSTTFRPLHGPATASVRLPGRDPLSLDVQRDGATLNVDGVPRQAGETWTIDLDYVAGAHYRGQLRLTVEGPMQHDVIRSEEPRMAFGVSTETSGYWTP